MPTDLREEIVRIDHSFTDKEQVFFRYIQESNAQNFTNNLWSSSSYPTTTTLLNQSAEAVLCAADIHLHSNDAERSIVGVSGSATTIASERKLSAITKPEHPVGVSGREHSE